MTWAEDNGYDGYDMLVEYADMEERMEREERKMALASVAHPVNTGGILGRIIKGTRGEAMRILLYGTEGIGKSTWAAGSPTPLIVQIRGERLPVSVAHKPRVAIETLEDLFALITEFRRETHEYQTLVIDSASGLEQIIYDAVKIEGKVDAIEEYGGGYGKGFTRGQEFLSRVLSQLELLQREKSIHIIILGHAVMKLFKNPEGDDYDRYILRCNDKFAGLLIQWPDEVLFAKYDVITRKVSAKAKAKPIGEPGRIVCTQKMGAYDAKNRHNLPPQMPLDWDKFWEHWSNPERADSETVEFLLQSWPLVEGYEEKTPATLKWLGVSAFTKPELMNAKQSLLLQLQDRITQVVVKEGE